MVHYTKYSNERRREFCVQTNIETDEKGVRFVRKLASFPEAGAHIRSMSGKYRLLLEDIAGTGLCVNRCTEQPEELGLCVGERAAFAPCGGSGEQVFFQFCEGRTLEEKLDGLLERGDVQGMLVEIRRYFAMFADGAVPFEETEDFREVFGQVYFSREQQCRRVSDIDMIFANAICRETSYELIDYEWTFCFPVPVRFLQYRCLYYYILGNAKRDALIRQDLYALFDIGAEEQEQFAAMERQFQSYILGDYVPIWKLYGDISDGVIPVLPLVEKESRIQRAMRTVEVFFDDGRGFGTWNWRRYQREADGISTIRIELPRGTKAVRIDPCGAKSVVRVVRLVQGDTPLACTSNGTAAPSGDLIFDTEDPQLVISELPCGERAVEISFLAEPVSGLAREVILNQDGRLRWMEQTKAWKLYRKLKRTGRG